MKCYNHIDRPAVAHCSDCGKGLCYECASRYSMPICADCNHRRGAKEISRIVSEMVLTFGIGAIAAYFFYKNTTAGHAYPLYYRVISYVMPFYLFSGVVPGWKTLTLLTPQVFLFLPLLGWVLYFVLKLALSFFVGIVMLPVRTVRNVMRLVTAFRV